MWSKVFGIGDLDGAAFTKLVAKMGSESGRFKPPVVVDPDAMTIRDASGFMNLANLHLEFLQHERRARLAFIRDVVLMPLTPEMVGGPWTECAPHLLPVVRDGSYLVLTELTAKAEHRRVPTIAHRRIAPSLFATVVVDRPEYMILVTEDTLAGWGVSLDTALDVAYTNLRAISQEPFVELIPGLWKCPWSGYASSRALLPEILQRVCTNPLVAIPSRDELLVADPERPGARDALMSLVATREEDSYPITNRIFHLHEKTLRAWTPHSENAVLLADFSNCVANQALRDYGEECKLHEALESETLVAPLSAVNVGEKIITQTMWLGDAIQELPPADIVLFVDMSASLENAPPMWGVRWDEVVAAGLVKPTSSPLPRWITGPFPSTEWLEQHALAPQEP